MDNPDRESIIQVKVAGVGRDVADKKKSVILFVELMDEIPESAISVDSFIHAQKTYTVSNFQIPRGAAANHAGFTVRASLKRFTAGDVGVLELTISRDAG